MTTQQIADSLVQYCRKGDWEGAHMALYAKDAISVEPHDSPGFDRETKGLDAIREKGEKWENMTEHTHKISVSEPMVAGNAFAVVMELDITLKQGGRQHVAELCVYETKDGKVIAERFFM